VIALLRLLIERIPQAQRGLALGVFVAGLPAGTGIAFDVLAPLGAKLGWRAEMGIAFLLLLGVLLVFLRAVPRTPHRRVHAPRLLPVLYNEQLWRLSLVTLLGYTAIIGFTTWAPTTLVTIARVPLWLGVVIASVLLVIDIPFAPLWGAVSDRLGRRKPFIVGGFTIYLIGSLVVPAVASASDWRIAGLLITITGMGVGCAMFFPATLAIPVETVEPEQVGLTCALFFMAQVNPTCSAPSSSARCWTSVLPPEHSSPSAPSRWRECWLASRSVAESRGKGRSGIVPGKGTAQAHKEVSRDDRHNLYQNKTEGKLVAQVTLTLSQSLWAELISFVGDFNDWNRAFYPLRRDCAGKWRLAGAFLVGRAYQFRSPLVIECGWVTTRRMPLCFML